MKEIKFLLYTLYVAGYTSLIWATVLWKGIIIGEEKCPIGIILCTFFTLINICICIVYINQNWYED